MHTKIYITIYKYSFRAWWYLITSIWDYTQFLKGKRIFTPGFWYLMDICTPITFWKCLKYIRKDTYYQSISISFMLGSILLRQFGITVSLKKTYFYPRIWAFNGHMHPHNLLKILKNIYVKLGLQLVFKRKTYFSLRIMAFNWHVHPHNLLKMLKNIRKDTY